MRPNPFVLPIAKILRCRTQPLSEYDLFQLLDFDDNELKLPTDSSNDLVLFRKHFLVMNALYQLQPIFWDEGYFLSISALSIERTALKSGTDTSIMHSAGDDEIRAYYLNWDEFIKSDQGSVEVLLDSFWQRYYALDEAENALAVLGMELEADWDSIKLKYQTLISTHHPDKGGDPDQFIKIREAYEVLSGIRH